MPFIRICIGIFLATGTSAQAFTTKVASLTPTTPPVAIPPPNLGGLAPCPPGILCPILPRKIDRRQAVATVVDEDCDEDEQSAALPVAPESTETVVICPSKGCEDELEEVIPPAKPTHAQSAKPAAPVVEPTPTAGQQQRVGVCPPEELPECSPDVCLPCTASGECPVCDAAVEAICLPPCPECAPPAPEVPATPVSTALPLTPTPTPIFSTSTAVSVSTATETETETETEPVDDLDFEQEVDSTMPTAAAERRAHLAAGVYMGMAAIFVALNWM